MQTFIQIKLQVEGIHCWPEARELIPEVGYLSDPHRHIFHIALIKDVFHDNRDVEFIQLKHIVQERLHLDYWDSTLKLCNFGRLSCEEIAKRLMLQFKCVEVSVFEDGENGAIVKQ